MMVALGILKWTPETFWNATFFEMSCAYTVHCQANKVEGWGDGLSDEDALSLLEAVNELKELYPDGKLSKAERRARAAIER